MSPPTDEELEREAEQQAFLNPPLLLSAPPPSYDWSPPVAALNKPIVVPEQTAQFGAPFSRCFPPILDLFNVNKDEFVDMIDRLNAVWAPSGLWNNVDVAANVIGFVPEPSCMFLGLGLQIVAQTALRVSQTKATNAFLKRLNAEYWSRRGLRVKVVSSKKVKKLLNFEDWNDDIDFSNVDRVPHRMTDPLPFHQPYMHPGQNLHHTHSLPAQLSDNPSSSARSPGGPTRPPWESAPSTRPPWEISANTNNHSRPSWETAQGRSRNTTTQSWEASSGQPLLPSSEGPVSPMRRKNSQESCTTIETLPQYRFDESELSRLSINEKNSYARPSEVQNHFQVPLRQNPHATVPSRQMPGSHQDPYLSLQAHLQSTGRKSHGSEPVSAEYYSNWSSSTTSSSRNPSSNSSAIPPHMIPDPRHRYDFVNEPDSALPPQTSYSGMNAYPTPSFSNSSEFQQYPQIDFTFGGDKRYDGYESRRKDTDFTNSSSSSNSSFPRMPNSASSVSSQTSTSSSIIKDPNAWAKKRMAIIGELVQPLDFDSIAPHPPTSKERFSVKAVNKFEDLQQRVVRQNFNGMQGRLEKRVNKAESKYENATSEKERVKLEKKVEKQKGKLNKRANKETTKLSWIVILPLNNTEGWQILDK